MRTHRSTSWRAGLGDNRRFGVSRPGSLARRWSVVPLLAGVLLLAGCSSEVGGTAAQQFTTAARTTSATPPAPTSGSAQVTLANPTSEGAATDTGSSVPASTSAPATSSNPATTATAPPTVTLPPSSTVTVVVTASTSPEVVTKTAQRPTVTATVTRTGGGNGATHTWSQWKSPSGNISCLVADGDVRCDINEMDFTAPKPASCNGVPKAIAMGRSGAPAFICISDTVADPSNPVLAYGESTTAGGFTCSSQEDGMHCSNGSGHSFRLARGSYDLN